MFELPTKVQLISWRKYSLRGVGFSWYFAASKPYKRSQLEVGFRDRSISKSLGAHSCRDGFMHLCGSDNLSARLGGMMKGLSNILQPLLGFFQEIAEYLDGLSSVWESRAACLKCKNFATGSPQSQKMSLAFCTYGLKWRATLAHHGQQEESKWAGWTECLYQLWFGHGLCENVSTNLMSSSMSVHLDGLQKSSSREFGGGFSQILP